MVVVGQVLAGGQGHSRSAYTRVCHGRKTLHLTSTSGSEVLPADTLTSGGPPPPAIESPFLPLYRVDKQPDTGGGAQRPVRRGCRHTLLL